MPRKRLEDELRAVWDEWSSPPEYGLWHEHKEPTLVERAEEAVGLTEEHKEAPEPVGSGGSGASAAPPSASKAHRGGGVVEPTPHKKKRVDEALDTPEKRAAAFSKLSPAVQTKSKTLLRQLPKGILLRGVQKLNSNKSKAIDLPVVPEAKANQLMTADGNKTTATFHKHVTKNMPAGYPIYVTKNAEGKPLYYWYKDKAGSTRRITGAALSKVLETS